MDPYIGELKLLPYDFTPRGWVQCNGQLLQKRHNEALFALIGTTYGGDGITTFALPDLRGRTPVNVGGPWEQGKPVGSERVKLGDEEMPSHTHRLIGSSAAATASNPRDALLGSGNLVYGPLAADSVTPLEPATVGRAGGGQPHENRPPYLGLMWCIAVQGLFPPRN
jgi:microcystin-dependent protein